MRQWFALGLVVIQVALLLVNVAPSAHRFRIFNWEIASFALALQMDGVTQLLLLTIFVPLAARWLVAPPRQLDGLGLLVLTAALLLAAADEPVTALVAWVLLDLALFIWRLAHDIERATALRSLAIGLLTEMILLAGVTLLPARPTEGATLIGLALWARLGLFPFHPLLPTRGADDCDLWFARGIPTIAAANLWLHWSMFRVSTPHTLIGVLAGATLVFAAISIWRAPDTTRAAAAGASAASVFVPLSIMFGGDGGIALALWQTLAFAFALALCEIAQRWRTENRNRYPRLVWFLALLALAGLPLTPAFLGRLALHAALAASGEWLLLLLAGTATLIILTPLWNQGLELRGSEAREPTRVEYAGLALAVITFAALAFAPMLIASALGIAESAERALDHVIRPNSALSVFGGAGILILSVVGSLFLRLAVREYRPNARSFIARLARMSELEWLERGLSHIGFQIGVTVRNAFTLTEENPTVWILFISLWVVIFIAIAR
jgi:hypothetical protein